MKVETSECARSVDPSSGSEMKSLTTNTPYYIALLRPEALVILSLIASLLVTFKPNPVVSTTSYSFSTVFSFFGILVLLVILFMKERTDPASSREKLLNHLLWLDITSMAVVISWQLAAALSSLPAAVLVWSITAASSLYGYADLF